MSCSMTVYDEQGWSESMSAQVSRSVIVEGDAILGRRIAGVDSGGLPFKLAMVRLMPYRIRGPQYSRPLLQDAEESLEEMSIHRKLMTFGCAAVLALGLAACGGGGDSSPTTDNGAEQGPTPEEQVTALQAEINALRTQLGLAADDDLSGSITELQNELAKLRQDVINADTKAMTAKLNKLATGIGVVDQAGTPTVATRDAANRKMGPRDTALDAPYMISGWSGMSWQSKAGSGATATTTTAVVYNDKGPDTPAAFNKRFASIAQTGDDAGQYRLSDADHGKLIEIAGLPTHASHAGLPVGTTNGVKGKLAGAPGTFTGNSAEIAITISATDGSPIWTGDLDFKPDSATATVMMPDTSYSSLGWWLTEAANGDLTPEVAAWASDDYSGTLPTAGKATFMGIAVGKYTHKTINSISGGHFNADAELEAAFDTGGTEITGTIDNFMSDGESIGDGWMVELAAGAASADAFDATAGLTITGGTATTAAAYSARGTFGTQKTPGTWTAQFVDDSRRDTMPGGVVGTFQIGETAHPVNMIGAFAATNQETDLPQN